MHPPQQTTCGYSSPPLHRSLPLPATFSSSSHLSKFPNCTFSLTIQLAPGPPTFFSPALCCCCGLELLVKTRLSKPPSSAAHFKFKARSSRKVHVRYTALHLAASARSCPNNNKVSLPQDLLNPKTVFSGTKGQFTPQDKQFFYFRNYEAKTFLQPQSRPLCLQC